MLLAITSSILAFTAAPVVGETQPEGTEIIQEVGTVAQRQRGGSRGSGSTRVSAPRQVSRPSAPRQVSRPAPSQRSAAPAYRAQSQPRLSQPQVQQQRMQQTRGNEAFRAPRSPSTASPAASHSPRVHQQVRGVPQPNYPRGNEVRDRETLVRSPGDRYPRNSNHRERDSRTDYRSNPDSPSRAERAFRSPDTRARTRSGSTNSTTDQTLIRTDRLPNARENPQRTNERWQTSRRQGRTVTSAPDSNRNQWNRYQAVNRNTNINNNQTVIVNQANTRVYRQVLRQPFYAPYYGPVFANPYAWDPFFYSDFAFRRANRMWWNCPVPFLSLGFFVNRPFSYYNTGFVGVGQPLFYGDDEYYRPRPTDLDDRIARNERLENGEQDLAMAPGNRGGSAQPQPNGLEEELLFELSQYVEHHTLEGLYRVQDPAFGNKTWQLELAQAPAIFEIDSDRYAVVAGFEGVLEDSEVPASVGLEFFLSRADSGWQVQDVWIASTNGIVREKLFQSPDFPLVQTWNREATCPFTGKALIPVPDEANPHG